MFQGFFFYLKMYIRPSYIFSWKLLSLVQSPGLQCLVGLLPAVFLTHFFSSLIIYFTLFSSLGPFKSAALLFVGVIVKLMHCLGNSQQILDQMIQLTSLNFSLCFQKEHVRIRSTSCSPNLLVFGIKSRREHNSSQSSFILHKKIM